MNQQDELRNMNRTNSIYAVIIRRFFEQFQHITYHGVPICKYVSRIYMNRWNAATIQKYLPQLRPAISRLDFSQFYHWFDDPYPYDAHPEGVVLMRGGFGDLAAIYLPPERSFLLCPNQAEVDLIKRNRPDLTTHSIQSYYKENPQAVASLTSQFTQVIEQYQDDPFTGTPEFRMWIQSRIPEIVKTLDAIESLFQRMNIGAVLSVSSTYSMDGAMNLLAKAHRVPSLTLQHGLIAEHDLFAHIPILATKKMVWGEATRQWYHKFGFPESRVAPIGSPRFDMIFNRPWRDKESLCKILNVPPSHQIIVYATQIFKYTQNIAPIVLEALQSVPNIVIVMLLHPGEKPEPYQQLVNGYPNCKLIQFGHISLYDALSGGDLFITYYSTAALEAMFFNLPVITVEPVKPSFSFGDLGASIKVANAAELKQAVKRLLKDPTYRQQSVQKYQQFLSQYCIPDGFAAKRLFDEVQQLCQTSGTA